MASRKRAAMQANRSNRDEGLLGEIDSNRHDRGNVVRGDCRFDGGTGAGRNYSNISVTLRWALVNGTERRRNRESDSRLDKLEMDVYFGNGVQNLSITTRLSLLEDAMDKLNNNLSKLVWLLLATLATGVVSVVLHLAGK